MLDGRDAAPAGDLVQSSPAPGRFATLPSVLRVLYDADAVYVGVRLFDPHPDSIVAPYPRRDDETVSDWVFVEVDTRLDRRTGFSFGLNPRGVQVDGTWAEDVNYDAAWNAVWSGAARMDSLGWTAEFRIPYSQVALARLRSGGAMSWGLNVYRYTPHRGEVSNWSPRLPDVQGVVSHFNLLTSLRAPSGRLALELLPYASVKAQLDGSLPLVSSRRDGTFGLDARMRPGPSSVVALSLHPDFGQVEADPALINLTTFESYLPEQRPLFLDGAEVFEFNSGLRFAARGTSFAEERPFYSRRIGRAPHGSLPGGAVDGSLATATTLLGALRASTRTAGGWTAGGFNAWTDEAQVRYHDSAGVSQSITTEPLTSFAVLRAAYSSPKGNDEAGTIATIVRRFGMPSAVDSQLPREALTAGLDSRHRFASSRYELTGFLLGSQVGGSGTAIGRLAAEPQHGYLRPGSVTEGPSSRSEFPRGSLTGLSAQVALTRLDGRFRWGLAGRVVTRGFESNDVGFQRNADWLLAVANWKYHSYRPGHLIRRWSLGSEQLGAGWTIGGVPRAAIANFTASVDFRNFWGTSWSWDHEFSVTDPEVLRGGPALRVPAQDRWRGTIYTDTRRSAQASLTWTGLREAAIGSSGTGLSIDASAFLTDRFQLGLNPAWESQDRAWQYVTTAADSTSGAPIYVLGALRQRTASLTARATYALSAHLTVQLYAQAFLSGGRYSRFQTVSDPDASRVQDRVKAVAPSQLQYDSFRRVYRASVAPERTFSFADPGFSDREFHLNAVLRWEFLPGSTVYLVWTQQRATAAVDDFNLGRDLGRLWGAPAVDLLQLKVSYRMGN